MIGTFDYHEKGCAIPHYIPEGKVADGCPIIVFPHRDLDIVAGETYDFMLRLTRKAVYVIDGKTYRVAHALIPRLVTEKDSPDISPAASAIIPPQTTRGSCQIGDVVDDGTAAKLAALRAQLTGN